MAQNDNAVLTAAKGFIYLAPEDTAPPADSVFATDGSFDMADVASPWVPVGHTSRDDLPEFGFDGGDAETRGSWQVESLRQVVTEVAVDYVTFNLLQFDSETLELYYGAANAATVGEKRYRLNDSPGSITRRALLVVVVDGDIAIGFYAPRSSIKREDAIAMATDDFAVLPIRATFLGGSPEGLFSWIGGTLAAVV